MANLQETATWEGGIRQLEITDPVLGGPDGIDNIAPRQLANRTLYLKKQQEATNQNLSSVAARVTAVEGVNQSQTQSINALGAGKEDKSVVAALSSRVGAVEAGKEDKSIVAALAVRVAEIEKKAAVFSAGGGMVLWRKPANEIPAGWAEVVDWRGRLPMGMDPGQTEYNAVGKIGGSKEITVGRQYLPNEGIAFQDAYYIENTPGGINGNIDTGVANKVGSSSSDNDNRYLFYRNATTSAMGSGNPLPILNPYRVVMFIEYVG